MRVVVVGAAGQARETSWYIEALGHTCIGFVVTDLRRVGQNDSRDRILGDATWIDAHLGEIDALALGIGAPQARRRVGLEMSGRYPNLEWPPIVHPSAIVHPSSVCLGRGATIGAGAIVTVNVSVGEFALVNFGATVGHDSRIGAGTVINPGANISGGVDIGEGSLIGAGAVILQYRKIGVNAIVGAGAVVTRDVGNGATVVGVPARPR